MKKQSLKGLKSKAWKLFSLYIRQRDDGVCYTCGIKQDFRSTHAGHFIHGKKYPLSYFDERNVNCQCPRCNRFLSGNLTVYAQRLVKQYGPQILDELHAEKNTIRPGREFYESIIEKYNPAGETKLTVL